MEGLWSNEECQCLVQWDFPEKRRHNQSKHLRTQIKKPMHTQRYLFFWLCHTARGTLVPRPGIEPRSSAVKARSPNHWTAREVPNPFFLNTPKRSFETTVSGFPRAAVTKYHKVGGLKQQKFVALQFWRLEVQNQGVSRVRSFQRFWGKICSMPLF